MWCDNQATVDAYKAMECTTRGRYIDVNYHYVRREFLRSNILLERVDTKLNLADLLTKVMPKEDFKRLVKLVFDEEPTV